MRLFIRFSRRCLSNIRETVIGLDKEDAKAMYFSGNLEKLLAETLEDCKR